MKKLLISGIFINIVLINVIAFASPSPSSTPSHSSSPSSTPSHFQSKELTHFIVRFETGNAYEVKIKKNLLRWKGIAGEDLNMIVEIPYKHIMLSKNVDIYQWNEKRGYFDTFIVDKSNAVAVTSTKNANNSEWLVKGKVNFLN